MSKLLYVASKTKHAPMWRDLRAKGWPIISTWIDEAGENETNDLTALWHTNFGEIRFCDRLLLYVEPNDFPLKGALIEVGMALAFDKRVYVYSPGVKFDERTFRPIGSWVMHNRVRLIDDLHDAILL